MEWVFVFFVLFFGLFIFYGVPWLFHNIVVPLFWFVLAVIDLSLDHVVSPTIRLLAEVLKTLWHEFFYWTIGDDNQE